MSTPQRSPIQQIKHDQSSYISESPYRQTQFNYQLPKIDHAFIIQRYRQLRIQQRNQLAKLRMPDHLKRKIFQFQDDQDLNYQKPDLVIFNHPFRGKSVLTRKQVEKQLQRQRKNAQVAQQFISKGQKVPQNILNQMGLQQEQIQIKQTKMKRQPSQQEQNYPRKPRLVSKEPSQKVAEQINRQQQLQQQNKMYFIHKDKNKQETQKQKTQKMKLLKDEKQNKQKQKGRKSGQKTMNDKSKSKDTKSRVNGYNDIPIVGQQPQVVRDIQFETARTLVDNKKSKKQIAKQKIQKEVKGYYRQFGNENEIHEFDKKQFRMNSIQNNRRSGSGEGLLKKNNFDQKQFQSKQQDKSISEISAIPSNDKDEDLSNSQSLNKALFLD